MQEHIALMNYSFEEDSVMALVHLAISIIVLGFLYRRMIIRETPGQIGKAQTAVPVFLGVISLPISFAFFNSERRDRISCRLFRRR